jgi:hypothetical protein
MKQVICRSGLKGWQARLRSVYGSFEEFISYCDAYGNHTRLGFSTPALAWAANPVIQGSVNPVDYCVSCYLLDSTRA